MLTNYQIINYCNEAIDSLALQIEAMSNSNVNGLLVLMAKKKAYEDVVRTAGYKPRGS